MKTENIKFDLIIVACSKNDNLIQITQNCIDSARQDEVDLNIIIVETCQIHKYKEVDNIIKYEGEFNYNHALNQGLAYSKGDIHILANNDIIFRKGWSKIGEGMIVNGFPSASALSEDRRQKHFRRGDWIYEGYLIGVHVSGWCIFVTKECIKQIGQLDESVEFWYSDNIYIDQLIAKGIKHGLFCNVQVDHITSATLLTISPQIQRQMSFGMMHKYKQIKNLQRNA